MQKRNIKLNVNGLILVNKPYGWSSNQTLTKIKKKFHPKRAGHTGTLDPLASGLLAICLGEATKFSRFLLNENKTYTAKLKLGYTSSTGDAEGTIIKKNEKINLSKQSINKILEDFKGEIIQTPPMFSALKVHGKPLYKYAREGIEIERNSRKIVISSLIIKDFINDELTIDISCSKGTYIRTLASDIGNKLGVGAYLSFLERMSIGNFKLKDAVSIENLDIMSERESRELIKPVDILLENFKIIHLDEKQTQFLKNGMVLELSNLKKGLHRLYDQNYNFFGLGECNDHGKLKVKRLITTSE